MSFVDPFDLLLRIDPSALFMEFGIFSRYRSFCCVFHKLRGESRGDGHANDAVDLDRRKTSDRLSFRGASVVQPRFPSGISVVNIHRFRLYYFDPFLLFCSATRHG